MKMFRLGFLGMNRGRGKTMPKLSLFALWTLLVGSHIWLAGCTGIGTSPRLIEKGKMDTRRLAGSIRDFLERDQAGWCTGLLDEIDIIGPLKVLSSSKGHITVQAPGDVRGTTLSIAFGQDLPSRASYRTEFTRSEWQTGDEFFLWNTPPETWKREQGRTGAAHVRGGVLLDAVLWGVN